jgi:hypothetical protein
MNPYLLGAAGLVAALAIADGYLHVARRDMPLPDGASLDF